MNLLFACCLSLNQILVGSIPPWVDYESRNNLFPSEKYLIGFSSRYYHPEENPNEVLSEVKNMSRIELTESVFLKINSQTELIVNQNGAETSISFEKSAVTRSSMDAMGLKTETYLDIEHNVAYGLSFIEKRKLALYYHKELTMELGEVEEMMKNINIQKSQTEQYGLLMRQQTKLQYVAGLQDLLFFLGITSEAALMRTKLKNLKYQVSDEIQKFRSSEDQSIEQLVKYFVEELVENVNPDHYAIFLKPVSFKNTKISTEFSDYLFEIGRQEMAKNFKILNKPEAKYILEGSYWPSTDKIQVSLNLQEVDGFETIGLIYGSSISIPIEYLHSQKIEYKPFDIEIQQARFNAMKKNLVVNGGLQANITVNKGNEPLLYKENDTLSLYVNVSRPAYIQIINVWNDGSQLLLLNNFYINNDQVNQNVKLPFEWLTACPCGIEYIKLIGQNTPFDSLNIQVKDGLDFIVGDIENVLVGVREKQLRNSNNTNNYFGESTIVLTTMERGTN